MTGVVSSTGLSFIDNGLFEVSQDLRQSLLQLSQDMLLRATPNLVG